MINSILANSGLSGDDLVRFEKELRPVLLSKGEYFTSDGTVCKNIAIVESGHLRTFHIHPEGHEVTTEFSGPGSFCSSYYSFYTHLPSFENIEAITSCKVHTLSFDSLQRMYAESFAVNVFGRKVLEHACTERDLRLKKILHLSAKERYEWFVEHYNETHKIAKLGSIASFLGMTQETLSRVRTQRA